MKIKVILLDNIKGVGKKEEIVEVKDGYANNFLFPQKKAVLANQENLNKLKNKNDKILKDEKKEIDNANKIKSEIDNKKIVIEVKSGDNGKIFGSIGAKEIIDEIEKQLKIKLDKKVLGSDSRLKEIGTHNLSLKLHKDVKATLVVNVKGK